MALRLTLDRRDLMNLVRGCSVPFEKMSHPLVAPYLDYYDQTCRQAWHGFEKLSEVELWTIYLVINPREVRGENSPSNN
jgi:hypothetical protein